MVKAVVLQNTHSSYMYYMYTFGGIVATIRRLPVADATATLLWMRWAGRKLAGPGPTYLLLNHCDIGARYGQ